MLNNQIVAVNVEDAWVQAKQMLRSEGYIMDSRVGKVIVHPYPVSTLYLNPKLRVLQDPVRDANPFFHLMESLWMLSGRNDVAWIKQFNARMVDYSDNGETFHGAYGHRWRKHFDLYGGAEDGFTDQLNKAIAMLKADPLSRRVVIQMWDPVADLWAPGDVQPYGVPKDLPCNTAIYFDCRAGKLNMTVTNRSNDIVWGCYGANVVHMSMLQEYMAAMIGVPMGWYNQMSHNWHAYLSIWDKQDFQVPPPDAPYHGAYLGKPYHLVTHPESFNEELEHFMSFDDKGGVYHNLFLSLVAKPMLRAWHSYRFGKQFGDAHAHLKSMPTDCDWHIAAARWLQRRERGNSSTVGDAVLGQ